MQDHKYKAGETVQAQARHLGLIPVGPYEVVRCLPATGPDLQYRIKSVRDGHERVVRENDLHP